MFVISTRNFPPDIGGIQNLMEGLANALVSHGPVRVYADVFQDSESYDKKSNLEIERISGFKIFRKYRKANLIHEFIRKNTVRAIFFDHWKSIENINEDIIKNIPSFCLIHSKEINHLKGTYLNKRMVKSLKKTKFVIANSNFTKSLAIKVGIDEKIINVINPGSNYPIMVEKNYANQAKEIFGDSFPKIITVARLDKRKSHRNILMCIRNLKSKYPKIKYVSIGNGDEKENLEELRKELNLENEVTLLYKTTEQLKVSLLSNSNLFLMPSVIYKKSIEGFGISFLEASCYGVGSIGGKEGGQADAIKHEETGLLCDGNRLDSIYSSVCKFFENDNHIKFGKNALEFSKKFKWSKIVKKYLELI